MNTRRIAFSLLAGFLTAALPVGADNYTDPPAPALGQTLSNGQKRITFAPYPAADIVRMLLIGICF